MKVAIFGYSEAKKGDELYQSAFQTAKLLARNGCEIINGAGPGVMRAATEGAHAGGGKAIGISFDASKMSFFEGRDPENKVDEEIKEKSYLERTMRLLALGDFYVVFNGGTGTLSEFAMAWGLARLYFDKHKPIIFYGQFWYEVIEVLAKNMRIRPKEKQVYRIATSPEEVLEAAKIFLLDRKK